MIIVSAEKRNEKHTLQIASLILLSLIEKGRERKAANKKFVCARESKDGYVCSTSRSSPVEGMVSCSLPRNFYSLHHRL